MERQVYNMRILIAEDESMIRKALRTLLERSKYTVDEAADGEEALDFIAVNAYDVIVLDIMMPKKSGLEVLKTTGSRCSRSCVRTEFPRR